MTVEAAFILPHPPLIIPDIGGGQEKMISSTVEAYHDAAGKIGRIKPETVVIISPHSIIYQDYFHISPGQGASGDFARFGDYHTRITAEYDAKMVSIIEELAGLEQLPAGTLGERSKSLDHGTMVPLFFIDQYLSDYMVIRVSISGLSSVDHYRFGKCLRKAIDKLGRKTVIIASGDLSHRLKEEGPYSFAKEGPEFDRQVTEAMSKGNFLSFLEFDEGFAEAAGECGLRGFIIMAGAFDGISVESKLLSYEGPFGVGYGVASFYPLGSDKTRHFDVLFEEKSRKELLKLREGEDEFVSLARSSLEAYIRQRKQITKPGALPPCMTDSRAGVFVSIKKHGRLRGCIGTIEPVEDSIADEIIRNAVSAGTGDPRFDPVTADELDELVYSVDVLGEPEPVGSTEDLDAKRYGVIVAKGRKRGLLLPNLDGITTAEQQLEIALKKAGISKKEDYRIERFEVVRHL